SAAVVNYDEIKELFSMRGTPGNPATLVWRGAGASAPQEMKADHVLYNRKTGDLSTGGVKVVATLDIERASLNRFGDINFVNSRRVSLPISLQENRRNELKDLLLFASWDQGHTYQQIASVSPDRKEFHFEADRDGLCWLRVAFVNRQGK